LNVAVSVKLNAIAPCSWTPEESQVERCEHQDNANIHCQPFPESVSEEHEIYTDYDGYHRHHVKHDSYLSAHFGVTPLMVAACTMIEMRRGQDDAGLPYLCGFREIGPTSRPAAAVAPRVRRTEPTPVGQTANRHVPRPAASLAIAGGAL
jgi:hypothetical protein